MKKYELTEETITIGSHTLHRVIALIDFGSVKKNDIGGWVENDRNLDQCGNAWVFGNAQVCGSAKVFGNAQVCGSAKVYGSAEVCGNAWVYGSAEVCDSVKVFGSAKVCGNARVCGDTDYIVFKNWWSSGRYFTWTRSNNMWSVGCFYGTGRELIIKAYADSELSGREYERVVRYVEAILKDEKK